MGINKGYLTAKTNKASDEVYTPSYAVEPLIKYIEKFCLNKSIERPIIWCPFDKEDSEYVQIFKKQKNFKVISSHIDEEGNFFSFEPEKYDIIISNPPFSIKDQILHRLFELNKPYAILMPLPVLQGQKRFDDIKDCEALVFDKRINFFKDKDKKEIQKGVSFASIYLCHNFLPEKLIFEKLKIDN